MLLGILPTGLHHTLQEESSVQQLINGLLGEVFAHPA
jgi:hypothetical protein